MYGKDERDLAVTLTRMADLARERTNFHQGEAKTKMAEWLQNDRRFDGFDPDRLIERVHQCRYNGATLDLTDPQLKRGGEPRPGDRWR
jgi:hypothetical protein